MWNKICAIISIWQRNVAGSSQAMEILGFKQCMDSLLVSGIIFDTFITDRHLAIAKYMRENLTQITHYFDLWHLKKSWVLLFFSKQSVIIWMRLPFWYIFLTPWLFHLEIHKALTKISKERGCEDLTEWIKPCGNHLMWSATSTPSGGGDLIWAKFESFMFHVINKHQDLPNGYFNKCAHEEAISDRCWLEEGMVACIRSSNNIPIL